MLSWMSCLLCLDQASVLPVAVAAPEARPAEVFHVDDPRLPSALRQQAAALPMPVHWLAFDGLDIVLLDAEGDLLDICTPEALMPPDSRADPAWPRLLGDCVQAFGAVLRKLLS